MTVRRMRIPCWITKATNTHSEYVILIAFPWQQWLQERASVLRVYVCTLPVFLFYKYSSLQVVKNLHVIVLFLQRPIISK